MDLTEAVQIEFDEIIKETDKAYQIKFDSENVVWIPKSQCRIIGNQAHLTKWIAKDKGLID